MFRRSPLSLLQSVGQKSWMRTGRVKDECRLQRQGRQRGGVGTAGGKVVVWRDALVWGWLWWHFMVCWG